MAKKNILDEVGADFSKMFEEAPIAPIQQVSPVATTKPEEKLVRLTFEIERALMIKIKQRCAVEGKSIKELCTEILEGNL
jgi:hypothetical protein